MTKPLFPVEPVRARYLTPFGGVTPELEEGQVGINADALAANTALPEGGEVLVSSDVDGSPRPLLARPFFRVVPLDANRPDAYSQSPGGEAVFASDDFGGSRLSLFDRLRRGAFVVLNATLAHKPGGSRTDWGAVVARRRFTQFGE